jgi:hypothetical protein
MAGVAGTTSGGSTVSTTSLERTGSGDWQSWCLEENSNSLDDPEPAIPAAEPAAQVRKHDDAFGEVIERIESFLEGARLRMLFARTLGSSSPSRSLSLSVGTSPAPGRGPTTGPGGRVARAAAAAGSRVNRRARSSARARARASDPASVVAAAPLKSRAGRRRRRVGGAPAARSSARANAG